MITTVHRGHDWFSAVFPGIRLAKAVCAVALFLAAASGPARAQVLTFNAVADFSLSNPSGAWSYGYGASLWSEPLTVPGSSSEYQWWSIGDYPYVSKNISGATIYGSDYFIPEDHLLIVPRTGARASCASLFQRQAPTPSRVISCN